MSNLIQINANGQAVASSHDIADHFEKRSDHVLRDIDALKKDIAAASWSMCAGWIAEGV